MQLAEGGGGMEEGSGTGIAKVGLHGTTLLTGRGEAKTDAAALAGQLGWLEHHLDTARLWV